MELTSDTVSVIVITDTVTYLCFVLLSVYIPS